MREKEIIKTLIREFHNTELPQFIRRQKEIPVNSGKIISIIGPRRSGKTYFLYQIMDILMQNGTDKRKILYINFEDERINLKAEELDLILQAYRELYPDINPQIPIQVCYELRDEETKKREVEGLIDCMRYHGVKEGVIITLNNEDQLNMNGYEIKIIPAYKLLLKEFENNIFLP